MKIRNIWSKVEEPLELHSDSRGKIVDIFYNKNIDHVAAITSKPYTVRGDHYHKETTQSILITKGFLEYWHKPADSDNDAEMIVARVGDLVTSPPFEVHTLVTRGDENHFIVFSEGARGGPDYESDTYRVQTIIPSSKDPRVNKGCENEL